ncbi:hypothetical protein GCM10010508_11200 [Streptomyces naganishii JCM 4654]|uniref:Uncharacterized protein n=1 Tax=Streptomyces naganishii JCM 4654 TaxID=1306179 RepID=A0A918Y0R4_9ACTN|nr:hypothetical protein GCM10010508_11200 [Streptomyces naganishii JCM 4654]
MVVRSRGRVAPLPAAGGSLVQRLRRYRGAALLLTWRRSGRNPALAGQVADAGEEFGGIRGGRVGIVAVAEPLVGALAGVVPAARFGGRRHGLRQLPVCGAARLGPNEGDERRARPTLWVLIIRRIRTDSPEEYL